MYIGSSIPFAEGSPITDGVPWRLWGVGSGGRRGFDLGSPRGCFFPNVTEFVHLKNNDMLRSLH